MLLLSKQAFYFQSNQLTLEKFKQEFGSLKSVKRNLWIYKSGKEYVVQPTYEFLTGNFIGKTVSFRGVIAENTDMLEFRGHFRSNLFFKIFVVFSLLVILFQVDFIAENLLLWVAILVIVFGIEVYLQYVKKSLIKKINSLFL